MDIIHLKIKQRDCSRQEQTTMQGKHDCNQYATVLKFGASVMKTHGAGFFFWGGGGGRGYV